MAAEIGNLEAHYQRELQSSLQRLGCPPNYPGVTLLTRFQSQGRGLGLKAARDIPRGTPILSEKELFSTVDKRQPTPAQQHDAEFQALSHPPAPSRTTRFDANSFQMGKDSEGREKRGVFLLASRFNHSCIPNAFFAWNSRSRRLTVHAILDIPRGEEIFLNYCAGDYLKTNLQRQQGLNHYSFQCTCPACQPDTAFGMESQQRRTQMRTLNNRIKRNRDATQRTERNQLLVDIDALALLQQQEGLFYPQLASSWHWKALWNIKEMGLAANGAESARYEAGILGEALQAARDVLDWDVVCTGYDSPEVKKTLRLICDMSQE